MAILLVLAVFFLFKSGDYVIFSNAFFLMKYFWWAILPIPMWYLFFMAWAEYSELMFVVKQEGVLLEIHPPADVEKSPKTMEQVFAGLHTFSTPNKFEIYCGWRPMQDKFTFEIASNEGKVHFYVRCPKASRNMVESQIYAQYPTAEIFEVEDYTKKVPKKLPNKEWDVWGSVLKLLKEDALPIRTYKHFKEDVTGKMIDPFASLTEILGNIGGDQHIWIQFIFSPANEPEWQPAGQKEILKIMGQEEKTKKGKIEGFLGDIFDVLRNVARTLFLADTDFSSAVEEAKEKFNINQLAPGEQEKLKAIDENLSRPGFNATIRFVYLGKKNVFNKAMGVAGVMGSFKQFAESNLNSIVPDNDTKTFANYYFTKSRMAYRQRKIVQDYRDRSFAGTGFFFNTEELATVYHFPDMSVATPAFDRIEAKKGEAPTNLPIVEM